jgi:hypothetical protein
MGETVVVMMPIILSQTSNPDLFTARHWMFVPIDRAALRGWINLSGVALINFPGQRFDFVRDTVTLDINEDLRRAIGNAPYKPQPGFFFATLAIEQWVPFATVNARGTVIGINDVDRLIASDGSAADSFSLDPSQGAMLRVDVAVKDEQSEIFRLGYQLSLYGSLVEEPILEVQSAKALAAARSTKPQQPRRRKRRA